MKQKFKPIISSFTCWVAVWTGVVIIVIILQCKVHSPMKASDSKFSEFDLHYHKVPLEEMTVKKLEEMYGVPQFTFNVGFGRWTEAKYKLADNFFLDVTIDPSSSQILSYGTHYTGG